MPKMSRIGQNSDGPFSCAHVRACVGCGHYFQPRGRQPGGQPIPAGQEKVELMTGGRAWIDEGGTLREVLPGDLIWHLPGDRNICRSDLEDPYRCLAISWSVSRPVPRPFPHVTRWDDLAEVRAWTRQITATWADQRLDRGLLALSTYSLLRLKAHTHAVTAGDPDLPAPLRRVLERMAREYTADLAIAELAAEAGWSPTNLHAQFRRHLGTSPHQHQLDLRLRAARERLVTGDEELGSIARACGFANPAALCRTFRKAMGMPPGEYRRRQPLGTAAGEGVA